MILRVAVKKRLARQSGLIVLSDLDGTLAPIADHPQAIRLPPETRRILARLARHPSARVGIVSGRSLRDLKRLVRIPTSAYAGCHGLEIAWRGIRFRHPGALATRPFLRRITRELRRKTRGFAGVLVEPKGLTVSVHYRLAGSRTVRALRGIVGEIVARGPHLEVLRGKKVLELRPRVAWGKGETVRLLHGILTKSLGRRSPLTLYLGDDETDEEAFRALGREALSIAVGRRRSRAAYRLPNPAAVQAFLAWVAEALQGTPLRR